jgi:hypothetical protein
MLGHQPASLQLHRLLLSSLLAALGIATAARAEGLLDGTKPLLCVSSEVFDCSGDTTCVEASAEGLNIPDLMRVDPSAKTISALDLEQRDQSSPIESVQVEEARLAFSGNDDQGRGWTLAIARDTGDSVLAVNDATTGLLVFGECTSP